MKRILLTGLVLLLGSLVLVADTYEHPEAGISIWFPNDWEVETDDGILEAEAPDDDAWAQLLVIPDVETLDAAVDAYTEELDNVIKNFKVTAEAEEVRYNGLEFYIMEGEGYTEGVKMEVGVALIWTGKAMIMAVTINPAESADKYADDFTKIVQSIKAI